jgi:hypothetical protein
MNMTNDEKVAAAMKWYLKNTEEEVVETDFSTGNRLSVVVGDGMHLELSWEEVTYRAELWEEDDEEVCS